MNKLIDDSKFRLGIFGINAGGGIAMTNVKERWHADWDDIVHVSQYADNAGYDFLLPLMRWSGYGGDSNPRGRCHETLTFASGLSGLTNDIGLIATCHVPLMNPVFVARALATIDQQSHGRVALNIVCNWYEAEFLMFGARNVGRERRWDQGGEWVTILKRLLAGDPSVDLDGDYFKVQGAVSDPSAFQKPNIPMISAAFSPAGRIYAATHCDFLFTTFSKLKNAKRQLAKLKEEISTINANMDVLTTTHVVCRPTTQEAKDYYDHYAIDHANMEAVETFIGAKSKDGGSLLAKAQRRKYQRIAGGFGSYPLIGTPESIAEEIKAIKEAGFAGTTLSFVNFKDELPYFTENVMPILEDMGLR